MRQKRRAPPRDLVRQQGPTAPDDNATRRPHTEAAGTKRPGSVALHSAVDPASIICGAHICCAPTRCLRERLQSKKRYVPTASGRLCCGQLRVNDFERRRPGDELLQRDVRV